MCDWGSYAQGTLSIVGGIMGQRSQAKAAQAQMNAQRKAAVTSMNREFMNFEIERQDNYDAAIQEIIKIRKNSMQLNSQVKAAVSETMSGNTARLIERNVEGDTADAVASVQQAYQSKSNEIDLNKETTLLSTKDYINNLNLSAPQMPSRFTNLVTAAGIGLGAYTQGMDARMQRRLASNRTGQGTGSNTQINTLTQILNAF